MEDIPEYGECRFSESKALFQSLAKILFRDGKIDESQFDDFSRNPHILSKDEIKALDVMIKDSLISRYNIPKESRSIMNKLEIEILNRAIDVLKEKPTSFVGVTLPLGTKIEGGTLDTDYTHPAHDYTTHR